jgi:hypothetical protein
VPSLPLVLITRRSRPSGPGLPPHDQMTSSRVGQARGTASDMARIKRSIRACSQTMGAPEVPQVVDFIHRALWRAWASVARHARKTASHGCSAGLSPAMPKFGAGPGAKRCPSSTAAQAADRFDRNARACRRHTMGEGRGSGRTSGCGACAASRRRAARQAARMGADPRRDPVAQRRSYTHRARRRAADRADWIPA